MPQFLVYRPALLALAVLLIATRLVAADSPVDVKQLSDSVDRHYNSLKSMRVEFTQIYSGTGMERTESGVLTLKKPGRMRWDYLEPRPKVFVSDGKQAWFYVHGEPQARNARIKELNDLRSPLRYLLGHTRLWKEFRGLSLAPDIPPLTPGGIVLRGVPEAAREQVSQTIIEVTPSFRIARLVIEERGGGVTEFRFRNEQGNIAVADTQFRFTPPPGIEVLRGEELGAP